MAAKVENTNYKNIIINALVGGLVSATTFYFFSKIVYRSKDNGMGIALKTFAFLPLKEQARLADVTTMQNTSNPKWLVEQFANVDPADPSTYQNANMITIANCAFVALYGKNEDAKNKCLIILENFKKIQ